MQPADEAATPEMQSVHLSNMLSDPQPTDNSPDNHSDTNVNADTESVVERRREYEALTERLRLDGAVPPQSPTIPSHQSQSLTMSKGTSQSQKSFYSQIPFLPASVRIQIGGQIVLQTALKSAITV